MKIYSCRVTAAEQEGDYNGIYAIVAASSVVNAKKVIEDRLTERGIVPIKDLVVIATLLRHGNSNLEEIIVVVDDKYKQYGE